MASIVWHCISIEVTSDRLGLVIGLLAEEGRNLRSHPMAEPEPANGRIKRRRMKKNGGPTSEDVVMQIMQDAGASLTIEQVGLPLSRLTPLSPNSAGPLLSSLTRQGKLVRIAPRTYALKGLL